MKTESKEEIKIKNGSYWLSIVFAVSLIFLGYKALVANSYTIFVLILLLITVVIIATARLRELVFANERLFYRSIWNKKVLWSIPFTSIKHIKIDFLSDTRMRNKKLQIDLLDGSKWKANATNITMQELGNICHASDIKLYYHLNEKYIEYSMSKNNVEK